MTAFQDNGPEPGPMSAAQAFAIARIGIGAGLLVLPRTLLRPWVGSDASTPGAVFLARGMGGRDVALGLGLLLAAHRNAPVRGWLEAGMLADGTDAVSSLLAARHLPNGGGWVMAAAAVVGVAAGRRLVSALP
ncbi:MAG: hypothetical protein M3179_03495 [Actinomycetota bacterium]|nr:hypothetical protein [Actinomycetota bacterium]